MREADDVYKGLNLFGGMIYNASRMPIWCFGEDGYFFYSTCADEMEFRMLLEHSGCLQYALSPERRRDCPIFLSDSIGLMWVADFVWENGTTTLMILLGPVFSSESSIKGIEDSLRKMDFSIRMRNNVIQRLKKVSVMNFTTLKQYAAMLHHIISGEISVDQEYEYQMSIPKDITGRNPEDISQLKQSPGETPDDTGADLEPMLEECIMQAIREGNINFDLDQATVNGGHQGSVSSMEIPHYSQGEVNRDEKNTVIIFVALCARAAMSGGLSPKVAKQMELTYVRKVEQTTSPTELIHLNTTMLRDFIGRVHDSQTHPAVSDSIQYCCDYVQRKLMVPFELADIAREVGYTEYYLTKKFRKEMGIHLTDYIKNARIEMAKILLMTTDRSIQEISEQLCFNTRGYFSKVFRDKVGVTPAAYRERAHLDRK